MDSRALFDAARKLGLELSDSQLVAFTEYEEALYDVNRHRNLTRVPREACWTRHFIDSLLCHDLFPQGSTVLDVGTGPGLPAWPLACARPDLKVTALDSSSKMIGFVESLPLPNLVSLLGRAEDLEPRESFDIVTGRAVAPVTVQLEISAHLCRIGGAVVPLRT